MNFLNIEINKVYEHIKTGGLYETLDLCKFKAGDWWVEGVIYCKKGSLSCKYSCSISDFCKRFKELV